MYDIGNTDIHQRILFNLYRKTLLHKNTSRHTWPLVFLWAHTTYMACHCRLSWPWLFSTISFRAFCAGLSRHTHVSGGSFLFHLPEYFSMHTSTALLFPYVSGALLKPCWGSVLKQQSHTRLFSDVNDLVLVNLSLFFWITLNLILS